VRGQCKDEQDGIGWDARKSERVGVFVGLWKWCSVVTHFLFLFWGGGQCTDYYGTTATYRIIR